MVSQPENSGGYDSTSDVSQSYQLQEAETVARSLWSDSQRFPVAWIVHLLFLSNTDLYLNSEGKTVGIAQVQLDLNKLSAEAAVEYSSIC